MIYKFALLQGFKYLYLKPEDFKKLSAINSVHAELIEDDGESRYKITDIIGLFLPHCNLSHVYTTKFSWPKSINENLVKSLSKENLVRVFFGQGRLFTLSKFLSNLYKKLMENS